MKKMKASKTDINYAWEWFKFHADQRTKVFHFYLLVTGALLYGLVIILNDNKSMDFVVLILSIFGFASSIAFFLLEKRNEELVNCGRNILENGKHQTYLLDLSRKEFSPSFKCFKDCDCIKYLMTHSFIFKAFIYTVSVFWLSIIINKGKTPENITDWYNDNQTLFLLALFFLFCFFIFGSCKYSNMLRGKNQ